MMAIDQLEEGEIPGDVQKLSHNVDLAFNSDEEDEREYLYIRPPQASIKHYKRDVYENKYEENKSLHKQKGRNAEVQIRSEKASYEVTESKEERIRRKHSSQDDSHPKSPKDDQLRKNHTFGEQSDVPVTHVLHDWKSSASDSPNQRLYSPIEKIGTLPELILRKQNGSGKEESESETRVNEKHQLLMVEKIKKKKKKKKKDILVTNKVKNRKEAKRKRKRKRKVYTSSSSSTSLSSTSSSRSSSSSSSSSESDSSETSLESSKHSETDSEYESSEIDVKRRKHSKSDRRHKSKSKRRRYNDAKGKKRKKRRRHGRSTRNKRHKVQDSTDTSTDSSDSKENGMGERFKKITDDHKNLPNICEESSKSSSETEEIEEKNIKLLETYESDGFSSVDGRDHISEFHSSSSKLDRASLPPYFPAIDGCRSVNEYEILEKIAEGAYGVVHKAKDRHTEEIVALKKLKMEKEKEGFPITSLREINTLLKAQHPNIVTVREIVVNTNIDKIYIVMDYIEHDLKSFMEEMKKKKEEFRPEEVKCLMLQLLRAVAHLHDNWILHRDLKTSNLLLSNRGILKVGDFGLAREYGSPLKPYSPVVVTLWYRAPELLLGTKKYSTSIDMWSVGCIFSELITMETLFRSKTEVEQINRIFRALGTPNERMWNGFNALPAIQNVRLTNYPPGRLWRQYNNKVTYNGMLLLQRFLTYDPVRRIAAKEAQDHDYFKEAPLPADPEEFAAMHNTDDTCYKISSVPSPIVLVDHKEQEEDLQEGFFMGMQETNHAEISTSFRLRF